ncbi:hypothetical protein AYO22_00309 [Fonsecaea multimorphosa]|nr:hypothetical protein AYO22_00309 [Fonsecaea multimorphosa]
MQESPLSELSLCISPCITAKTKLLTDPAIDYHVYSLIHKVHVLCKVLEGLKPPTANEKLSGQKMLYLKAINLAPVLTMIAANDMQKLAWRTTINIVQVSQLSARWRATTISIVQVPQLTARRRPTTVTTFEMLNYGILVTWAI